MAHDYNGLMALKISRKLQEICRKSTADAAWLEQLPEVLRKLQIDWSLSLGEVFNTEGGTCSYVSKAILADRAHAVLKIGFPHMEGRDEIDGLCFWAGDPTIRLLAADKDRNAMLLEKCEPGNSLRVVPSDEQDIVIAKMLRRLWRKPSEPHPFRQLSQMLKYWIDETRRQERDWTDKGLVQEGLQLFDELPQSAAEEVLLATDLHAGNVLRAEREPWLVIDPKPFVGDLAYDATQHLLNSQERLLSKPNQRIKSFADLLGVNAERLRLWTFARAAAEPRADWRNSALTEIARRLAS